MGNVLWRIYSFFTPYVHPFERKAERFFQSMRSQHGRRNVEKRLEKLMQENTLILNIWLEKRFKNYTYLTKRVRRKLYANATLIEKDFGKFLKARAHRTARDCLAALTQYFQPGKWYTYRESATFGKLLVNPGHEQFIGDCNQIVTLYAHLFSKHFKIGELKIKLLPGHVCLHYNGEDIEATNGTFKKYEKYESIAPITELITTNLLDINDPDEKTRSIDPQVFVKGAQLARAISTKHELVEHNIQVAYHNLAVHALNKKDFQTGYFYAQKTGEESLLHACYAAEFNVLIARVAKVKTIREARTYKQTYKKLHELAGKMKNDEARKQIESTLRRI
ncbi:hypothetical protein KBD59_01625 [Candidatus Gracilibacteria bacterium]|nr:hypothetical protein [Candidatus Gracilibacteria bacterium]